MLINITRRQHSTILAALRLWQEQTIIPDHLIDIAVDGQFDGEPLTDDEIDDLCERINCAGNPWVLVGDTEDGIRLFGPFDTIAEALSVDVARNIFVGELTDEEH